MTDLVPLDFEGRHVRMVERADEMWWVLADVCRALDIANPSNVAARLDNDEKDTLQIAEGIAGNPNVTIITEPGLYAVILQSRKPIARRFDRWIRHDVLPKIRKTGQYVTQFDGAVVLQQIDAFTAKFERRFDDLERLARSKRRRPSEQDRLTASRFAKQHGGSCPCCRRRDVVDASGIIINNAQVDHFFQVDRISLKTSWLICGECHGKLTSGIMPREMCVGRFKAYQELLSEWLSEDIGPIFSLDPQPEPAVDPAPQSAAAAACCVVAKAPTAEPRALVPANDPRQGRML